MSIRPFLLCAALSAASAAVARAEGAAPGAAPAPAPAPGAQAAFDPAPYLAENRWHDGCYGLSMREPAGMARDGTQARWTLKEGGADYEILAQFILPPPHMGDRPPEPLQLDKSLGQLVENLRAGRGWFVGLSQFDRDQTVDGKPMRVRYFLQHIQQPGKPPAKEAKPADAESFLLGVAVVHVNPRCQLALRLVCRIPPGAGEEVPALEDARRRFEAMLGSVKTTPEAVLAAARKAQVERGEKALALLAGARAELPKNFLLRVVKGGGDLGWMSLDLRHQDAAWYKEHPARANAADGLGMPGFMVRVRTHMQGGSGKEAWQADTTQDYFKADATPMAPELRAVLASRAEEDAFRVARARGADAGEAKAIAAAAGARAGRPDRFSHESWQRIVTLREEGRTTGSSLERGFLAAPSGGDPIARLRLEWAGSTPPELANFFSNPSWRENLERQSRKWDLMLSERIGGPGATAGVPAATGKDQEGALAGDRKLAQWGMPIDLPCLSQAHLWLMPWLLRKEGAQSCAFFCYSPQAKRPGLCLYTAKPAEDGSCEVVFRPAYDQPEQVFSFGPDGALRRIQLPDGTVLLPTSVEEMARIWKLDSPPGKP